MWSPTLDQALLEGPQSVAVAGARLNISVAKCTILSFWDQLSPILFSLRLYMLDSACACFWVNGIEIATEITP